MNNNDAAARPLRERPKVDYAQLNRGGRPPTPGPQATTIPASPTSATSSTPSSATTRRRSSLLSQSHLSPPQPSSSSFFDDASPVSLSAAHAAAAATGDESASETGGVRRSSRIRARRSADGGESDASVASVSSAASGTSATPRRSRRKSVRGSSAEPTSARKGREPTILEDDEKENLPSFAPDGVTALQGEALTSRSPLSAWAAASVRRVMEAISPSTTAGKRKGSTSSHASNDDLEIIDQRELVLDGENDGGDEEVVTMVEVQYGDEGDSDESTQRASSDVDEDQQGNVSTVILPVDWSNRPILARLLDNRLVDVARPVFSPIYTALRYLYRLIASTIDLLIITPGEIVWDAVVSASSLVSIPLLLILSAIGSAATALFIYRAEIGDAVSSYSLKASDLLKSAAPNLTSFTSSDASAWNPFPAGLGNLSFSLPSLGWLDVNLTGLTTYLPANIFFVSPGTDDDEKPSTWSYFNPANLFWSSVDRPLAPFNPEDTENLANTERLKALETALNNLQREIVSNGNRVKSLTHSQNEHSSRLDKSADAVSSLRKSLESLQKTNEALFATASSDLLAATANLRKELQEQVLSQLDLLREEVAADREIAREETKAQYESVSASLDKLTHEMELARKRQEDIEAKLKDKVREIVASEVPPLLVARKLDASGNIELDPAFLAYLERKFAERGSTGTVRNAEQEQTGTSSQIDGISAEQMRAKAKIEAIESSVERLDTLVAANEEDRLRDRQELTNSLDTVLAQSKMYVNDVLSGRVRPSEGESLIVMTRDEVVEYFQKEISKISSVGSAPSVEVLLPILDEVVQRSLARYAADAIGRPDFALGTAGAVIVTSLTSQTLATASDSFIGKWLGQKIVRGWGPYYALTPGTMPGQCWSMEGSSGSIGLQLARPAVPTDFTIDHVSPDLILDSVHGLESAPKDVELWAVLDVAAFRELNLDLQDNRLPVLSRTREDGSVSLNAGLLLSVQRFDPRKGSIQTFPVLPEAVKAIRSNKVVPNKVLLRILSNWGHPDYTCLYRLRIHGKDV